jgi:hypothetical protein
MVFMTRVGPMRGASVRRPRHQFDRVCFGDRFHIHEALSEGLLSLVSLTLTCFKVFLDALTSALMTTPLKRSRRKWFDLFDTQTTGKGVFLM